MAKDHILAIGVMTGNSLDAADVVLTAFHDDGRIVDLGFFSLSSPEWLYHALKDLRAAINRQNGDMSWIAAHYLYRTPEKEYTFDDVLDRYMQFVAQAVGELIKTCQSAPHFQPDYSFDAIDLIGFHGQTCAHLPPSIAQDPSAVYTVQIGDGQRLADLTGITTVYDFRSDDVMAGGEGAPLAPMHNSHIAAGLQKTGVFPITFINGGNTSNIAHITFDEAGDVVVTGWDAGPFNHLPDALMRAEKNLPCDHDGHIAQTGQIDPTLLKDLFDHAAVDRQGRNFLMVPPPKSSDPEWYRIIPELSSPRLPFQNRLRTAAYFSAYALFHSLGHTPSTHVMPRHIAVFGGGWKNPVIYNDFINLLAGDAAAPVLPEHRDAFDTIRNRIRQSGAPAVAPSSDYGFDGNAMEARIFADMARCKILGLPFTNRDTTNVAHPVVCGVVRLPLGQPEKATENLRQRMPREPLAAEGLLSDPRWSRAASGWQR